MAPVQCKIVGGKVIPAFEMLESSNMKELKIMTQAITGVRVDRQTLRFNRGGVELLNGRSIGSYGYKGEALIHLDVSPLPGDPEFDIFLRASPGNIITMKVKETSTVGCIRQKLNDMANIPMDKIRLVCLNTPMKENELHLSDYYICEGALVDVALEK